MMDKKAMVTLSVWYICIQGCLFNINFPGSIRKFFCLSHSQVDRRNLRNYYYYYYDGIDFVISFKAIISLSRTFKHVTYAFLDIYL